MTNNRHNQHNTLNRHQMQRHMQQMMNIEKEKRRREGSYFMNDLPIITMPC